jgi:glutathione S-transferase-like protein
MAVKLHRCSNTWLKVEPHPCWRVQNALDEAGVEYEVVKHPNRRGKRIEIEERTRQKMLPVIELENGEFYRDESKRMVERIRSGELTPARVA